MADLAAGVAQVQARFQLRAVFDAPTRQPGNKETRDALLAREEEVIFRELQRFLKMTERNVKEIFEQFVDEFREDEKIVSSDHLLE